MNQLPSTPPSQSEQVDLGQNTQNLDSTMRHHDDEEGDESRSHNIEDDEDNMTEINVDDINHENGQVVSRLERNSNTMVQHWTPVSRYFTKYIIWYPSGKWTTVSVTLWICLLQHTISHALCTHLFLGGGRRVRTGKKRTFASRTSSYPKN